MLRTVGSETSKWLASWLTYSPIDRTVGSKTCRVDGFKTVWVDTNAVVAGFKYTLQSQDILQRVQNRNAKLLHMNETGKCVYGYKLLHLFLPYMYIFPIKRAVSFEAGRPAWKQATTMLGSTQPVSKPFTQLVLEPTVRSMGE